MKEAYSLAAKNNLQSTVTGKKQYNKKVQFLSLKHADRVLVRNLSERGSPGKLRSYWEQQIHVVVGQRGNLPVYEIRPEGQTGKPRVSHRNLLLLCTFLPVAPLEPPLHSIRDTVSTSPSKTATGRPQTYEFSASESEDKDEPLVCCLQSSRHSRYLHLQETLNVSWQTSQSRIQMKL